jgi:hypothetical protein
MWRTASFLGSTGRLPDSSVRRARVEARGRDAHWTGDHPIVDRARGRACGDGSGARHVVVREVVASAPDRLTRPAYFPVRFRGAARPVDDVAADGPAARQNRGSWVGWCATKARVRRGRAARVGRARARTAGASGGCASGARTGARRRGRSHARRAPVERVASITSRAVGRSGAWRSARPQCADEALQAVAVLMTGIGRRGRRGAARACQEREHQGEDRSFHGGDSAHGQGASVPTQSKQPDAPGGQRLPH